jgi:hypothetical protein
MQPNPNPNAAFNQAIRSAGNRSRAIPNIGQGPTATPPPMPSLQTPSPQASPPSLPQAGPMQVGAPVPPQQTASPMAAPKTGPQTFTMHPPGSSADVAQYNYEPQPDGSWRVYPPGVGAPPHTFQASLPRAASTGDFIRMSQAFRGGSQAPGPTGYPQPMQAPQP